MPYYRSTNQLELEVYLVYIHRPHMAFGIYIIIAYISVRQS